MLFAKSTQQFLEFHDIKEGVVILKNKALRGILLVSSVNFDLKSEEEQQAIIYQFQNFLNSLDFSVQILVRSRRLNITGYFDELKKLEREQKNELLKLQIAEYRRFIEELLEEGDIMRKEFFVVVPFTLTEAKGVSAGLLKSIKGGEDFFGYGEEVFKRCREQLWQRMEFVAIGLRRCGLTAFPLSTPELIELFWSWYHPKEAEFGYYPEILPELLK
jgi:type IV secretory pathway VirB4 component